MAESGFGHSKHRIVFRTSSQGLSSGEKCEQGSTCLRTWRTWRSKRWWFACIAHAVMLENLLVSNASRQDIKHHFEEAANWLSDRESQNALSMRIWLGELLKDKIQDLDEALALFTGVVQIVSKKLYQPATMSGEDARRFLEPLYKSASRHMAHTYIELASRSYLVINEYLKIAGESLISSNLRRKRQDILPGPGESLLSPYSRFSFISRNVLLRVKRSKGRLSKCLDDTTECYLKKGLLWEERSGLMATSSSRESVGPIDDRHSPRAPGPDQRLRFHNDEDWALKFLLNGDAFHGSKMLFIVYTMMANDELGAWVVDGVDGTIHAFSRIKLSHYIDEETQRFAENELAEGKNPGIEHAAILRALYAMDNPENGTDIYKRCILGLVAGLQRRAQSIQSTSCQLSNLEKGFNDILGALYRVFIEPIEEALKQFADYTLSFMPNESYLRIIPFSALRRDNNYLIENYRISVSQYGSMWIARHCQRLYDKQLQTPCGSELLVGRIHGYPNHPKEYCDLLKAHDEIKSIKKFCGRSACEVLESGDCAERPMKERVMERLQTTSWAHFAVHGDVDSHLSPHLLLGDNDTTRWTPDDFTQLPWARSAVLSACHSGLGSLTGGSVSGFARALFHAGVPSCVLSMWEVQEDFCLNFMEQLYKHLKEGKILAHAMQESTNHMMKMPKWPNSKRDKEPKWSVLHWAAFSCVGYGGVKFLT